MPIKIDATTTKAKTRTHGQKIIPNNATQKLIVCRKAL